MSRVDDVKAFMPGERATLAPLGHGVLDGLSFAVKDLFDVAGTPTTYGNPDWARTHPTAAATAPVVLDLLEAGAALAGKTKTVELAYGLTGENTWYETPLNPRAPDRFPGGSSCGSAAAVAGGLVDFALGSDTGGSVRIPASYCGLYGLRPSWGAISLAGACGLAPSFDTCGWFARSAAVMERVGAALLPAEEGGRGLSGILLKAEEPWINAEPATARALGAAMSALEKIGGAPLRVDVAPEGLPALYEHFRCIQAQEAWATLGSWVVATKPRFGPGVAERFSAAREMDPAKAAAGRAFRRAFRARLHAVLAGGAVMVYPTSPCAAPLLTASPGNQNTVREATMGVTAIAGLAGLCEVTLPVGQVEGAPVGLSLVAAPGRDHSLLRLAGAIAEELGLE
ncbi:amidase [Roseococcus pinisoli]|uniref:Amidase n=1 Tax=Roseococcus pinisoli TaxID=2835040 RepID=A0ABS5QA66_9PROT|nr:amidase [Roseococcus pinisoli]MBS7810597.1 amidase [Roseococcus pinisoli]